MGFEGGTEGSDFGSGVVDESREILDILRGYQSGSRLIPDRSRGKGQEKSPILLIRLLPLPLSLCADPSVLSR